jgi:hypothetical protein
LDFSLSFCLRHPAAWPAAFQVMSKKNAESSHALFMSIYGAGQEEVLQRHLNFIAFSLPDRL